VLGTASFPTASAGYRDLLGWVRQHGSVDRVGVEGTGSYGSGLAQYLQANDVTVVEVSRPSRQVRRRYGKSDVIDAIAAARTVLAGEATTVPKSHDGSVEALRMLKLLQRSVSKARVVALNQLHNLVVTAPDELRSRLRDLDRKSLLTTCMAFRVRAGDDSLGAIIRFSLRELAPSRNPSRAPARRDNTAHRPPDTRVGSAAARDQRRRARRRLDSARHHRRQP
jgi:transposase